MRNKWLAAVGLVLAALIVAACSSSTTASRSAGTASPAHTTPAHTPHATSSPTAPAAAGTALKTAKVGGAAVLTSAKGFTLYWFAPDTHTTSKCNGACAASWPPVAGPVTAGHGVTGHLGTIKRSDGALQATYNGHPLYTFVADHSPGQHNGNNVNAFGGLWKVVPVIGSAPAASPTSHATGGGY